MLIEQAIQRVRAFRKERGWNLSQFAREAGLKESTIRKMDEPSWNPEINTLRKLEAVIGTEMPTT